MVMACVPAGNCECAITQESQGDFEKGCGSAILGVQDDFQRLVIPEKQGHGVDAKSCDMSFARIHGLDIHTRKDFRFGNEAAAPGQPDIRDTPVGADDPALYRQAKSRRGEVVGHGRVQVRLDAVDP
ncbi:MAG: hypothetical protein P4L92_19925 [Rudaea sp.]|nr:hypothetical protein [Rudaea sp.]